MYKIGEFSKIVGITTKTLRYYDAEGILSPANRDKETGYRLYSETDIEKASIVSEVDFPAMKVATLRFEGAYHEIGQYYERLYKIVKNRVAGVPITCYGSLEYSDRAHIEVCVPVTETINTEGVVTKNLCARRALRVVHIGNYDKLNFAYRALFDYANEHRLSYTAPLIEVYKKGYGTTMAGNPQKYLTEIYLPISE